jgi:hypothetical protein
MPDQPSEIPLERAILVAIREECAARGRSPAEVLAAAGVAADEQTALAWREVMALCRVLGLRPSELTARAEAIAQGESGR